MEAFIGSVMLVAFPFAPVGWMPCNGQVLLISQYQAVFALLGVQYGGDGRANFALPNLNHSNPIKDTDGAPLTWIICVQGIFPSRP